MEKQQAREEMNQRHLAMALDIQSTALATLKEIADDEKRPEQERLKAQRALDAIVQKLGKTTVEGR